MFDDSQIDKIDNRGEITTNAFVWNTHKPRVYEIIRGKNNYYTSSFYTGRKTDRLEGNAASLIEYGEARVVAGRRYASLRNQTKADVVSGFDACLYDYSRANEVSGTWVYLQNRSYANYIDGDSVKICDKATSGTVKANKECSLYNNATANKIITPSAAVCDNSFAQDVTSDKLLITGTSKVNNVNTYKLVMRDSSYLKNAKVKEKLEMQPNCIIENLIMDNENLEIDICDNSQIKNIKGKKIALNLNKAFDNIEGENVKLFGTIKANNLETQNADISENVKINTIKVKDKLVLKDNVEVDNIIVTGDNPEIVINGNVKINGQIIFENTEGSVIVKSDSMGNLPAIRRSQVKNGKIGGDYKPIGFEKVVGMDDLKRMLYEDVINPSSRAQDYINYGLEPVNGFLLYGPPGCGKTFLINALAEETGRYFVNMPASSVVSSYLHGTSQKIAQKFNEAFANAPSLIFIDEVEALAPIRDSLNDGSCSVDINEQVTELLQQINNCKDKDVFVVFASNEPQKIDNAIKRTGRIDKKIYLGPPDLESRKAMFERNLKTISKKENNIDTTKLAELTNNYTAEDIRMVVRQASIFAMRDSKNISLDDLIHAIAITKPSLTDSMVESYKRKGELI